MQSRGSDAGNADASARAAEEAALRADVERARREVEHGRTGTLTRRWPDIVAVLAAVILLGRVAHVLWTGPDEPTRELVAGADLTAFTVLQVDQMVKLDGKADSLRKKLAGRYLLRSIQKGSPVRPADVGPATVTPALLRGRHVLPLQLAPGAAPDSLRAGAIADLLLSPATPQPGATPAFVQRVPVLAASPAGEGMRVVVAVDRAQLDALAPRIGTSRVFVLTGGGAPAVTARDTTRAPAASEGG